MKRRALVALAVVACAGEQKKPTTPAPPPAPGVEAAPPEVGPPPVEQPPADLLAKLDSPDERVRLAAVRRIQRMGFVPRGSRVPGFVNVSDLDPTIVIDMVFFTGQNLVGRNFYGLNACFLREETAQKVLAASERLRAQGYRLAVRDCYRPLSVQAALVDAPEYDGVAAEMEYANHPRGAAVDAKLADADGRQLPPTPRGVAFRTVMGSDAVVPEPYATRRLLVREALIGAGMRPIRREFWHFDLPQPKRHEQMDVPVAAMTGWAKPDAGAPAVSAAPPGDPEPMGGGW